MNNTTNKAIIATGSDANNLSVENAFIKSIKTCFEKYVDFDSRATRSEFWYFRLFTTLLVPFSIGFMEGLFFPDSIYLEWGEPAPLDWMLGLFTLAVFLPELAVAIRRLHDTNHSGWWLLLAFTGIGIIPLIIWWCTAGDEKANEFGPSVQ